MHNASCSIDGSDFKVRVRRLNLGSRPTEVAMHSFNIDIIFLPSIIIQLLSFIIFNAGQDIYYMYLLVTILLHMLHMS